MEVVATAPSRAVAEKRSAEGRERALSRLHGLLRRLDAEKRRAVIAEKLSQQERLDLENFIRDRAELEGVAAAFGRHQLWHCRSDRGWRVAVSVAPHLWIQSALCKDHRAVIAALGFLLSLRARCRRREGTVAAALSQDVEALHAQQEDFAAQRIFMRTRVSFARGVQLTTPLRSDFDVAVQEWRQLSRARGRALRVGRRLLPGYTPEAAEAQWVESCQAWTAIWAHSGRSSAELGVRLRAKELLFMRPIWAKVRAGLWRVQTNDQSAILGRIDRLLHELAAELAPSLGKRRWETLAARKRRRTGDT